MNGQGEITYNQNASIVLRISLKYTGLLDTDKRESRASVPDVLESVACSLGNPRPEWE